MKTWWTRAKVCRRRVHGWQRGPNSTPKICAKNHYIMANLLYEFLKLTHGTNWNIPNAFGSVKHAKCTTPIGQILTWPTLTVWACDWNVSVLILEFSSNFCDKLFTVCFMKKIIIPSPYCYTRFHISFQWNVNKMLATSSKKRMWLSFERLTDRVWLTMYDWRTVWLNWLCNWLYDWLYDWLSVWLTV